MFFLLKAKFIFNVHKTTNNGPKLSRIKEYAYLRILLLISLKDSSLADEELSGSVNILYKPVCDRGT